MNLHAMTPALKRHQIVCFDEEYYQVAEVHAMSSGYVYVFAPDPGTVNSIKGRVVTHLQWEKAQKH